MVVDPSVRSVKVVRWEISFRSAPLQSCRSLNVRHLISLEGRIGEKVTAASQIPDDRFYAMSK